MIENPEAGDQAVLPASEPWTNSEAPEFAPANKPGDSGLLRAGYTATALELEDVSKDAIDLYWLAFLLTGCPDISVDIAADTAVSHDYANPFFASWMRVWARKIVIGKALAAIRNELAESARRTKVARLDRWAAPPRDWTLRPNTNKTQIEEALLAIDVFPRAAVLLLTFEGLWITDVATLLDVDAALVRKGQAIGLRDLTINFSRKKDYAVPDTSPAQALP